MMDFLVSGTHFPPVYLMGIGFVMGILGGFFGVGGSFLTGPSLFAIGMPMNFVVGTDLANTVGLSIVAAKKHRTLGNVDLRLGLIMVGGTVAGVETGAQAIQHLKRLGNVDVVVGAGFIVILVMISALITWEGLKTRKMHLDKPEKDVSAFGFIAQRVQRFHLPPMIALPISGIQQISLWVVLVVAFVGGVFSGFLGGGAGYIRMPSLVFILGVPTHVAVGTDLFEIIMSAGYGTLTHALKGNVDIMVALVMNAGAAVGAQIGASMTEFFQGSRIRLAFAPLPLLGAGLVLYSLITGQHFK